MYVYMHLNKINNKRYIGITKDINVRFSRKERGYKSSWKFYNALNKYGWDGFEHIILFSNLTEEEALLKEKELISNYKSSNSKYGYNIALGGRAANCLKHSDETKDKISDIIKKKALDVEYRKKISEGVKLAYKKDPTYAKRVTDIWRSGKKGDFSQSEETKRKISNTLKEKHLNGSLTVSDETKKKISLKMKGKNRPKFSEDRKKNISEAMKKSWQKRKIQK